MQHKVLTAYQHFGTNYQSQLQWSRNPKERERNTLTKSCVLGLCPSSRCMMFQKPALFLFSGKEAPNVVDPSNEVLLNQRAPQKQ
jgi:hypothetical protein